MKKILMVTLPVLFLSACSVSNQQTEHDFDFFSKKTMSLEKAKESTSNPPTQGMALVRVCGDLNKDEKYPNWTCKEGSVLLDDGQFVSVESMGYMSGESVTHNEGAITHKTETSYVDDGLTLMVKNKELEFYFSSIIDLKTNPESNIESPVVVKCKNKVSFVEQSNEDFTSKYCFFEYTKHLKI